MLEPIETSNLNWFGKKIKLELFTDTNFENLSPISQVQAVCFVGKNKIVLYRNKRGGYGCPGGGIEKGESFEEALGREIYEEVAGKLIKSGRIGYIKETNPDTGETTYMLRYWARVKLLDEPINDPCDDSRSRDVFTPGEAIKKLNWGKTGEALINIAGQSSGLLSN